MADTLIRPDLGGVSLVGTTVGRANGPTIIPATASSLFVGAASAVSLGVPAVPNTGAITFTGYSQPLIHPVTLIQTPAALTFFSQAPHVANSTYPGQMAGSSLLYDMLSPTVSVSHETVDQWITPAAFMAMRELARFGPHTHHGAIAVSHRNLTGAHVQASFFDDWYNRIHITPNPMGLGNILSNMTKAVEVWSSYFTPRTLLSVTSSGGYGITLNQPTLPVTVFGTLESRTYTVNVDLIGPAIANSTYTFTWDVTTVDLKISGIRTIVFSFRPNWDTPPVERLEWLTNVLVSRDGEEQRIQLREHPRKQIRYTALAYEDEYQYLDSLISGWQSRVYALPIWHDKQIMPTSVSGGSTSIQLPVADPCADFHAGGIAVIGTDARHTEGLVISAFDGQILTLSKPTDNFWPVASWIAPARTARMKPTQNVSRPTAKLSQAALVFDLVDMENYVGTYTPTVTYKGVEVCPWVPDRAVDISVDYMRIQDVQDYQTGIITIDDIPGRSFTVRQNDILLWTRADILTFRQWLNTRAGQRTPFYMPTYERNIEPVATMAASSSTMSVLSQGFSALLNSMGGKTDVAMLHRNNTWYYRQIGSFSATADPEIELMSLDLPIGLTTDPSDWQMICFMEKVRLGADAVEMAWETDTIMRAKVPVKGVFA